MNKGLFDTEAVENTPCSNIVTVAFDSGVDRVFDYLLPDKLGHVTPGQRVEVPFGRANKTVSGFCVSVKKASQQGGSSFKLKIVKKIVDQAVLIDAELMTLAHWIGDYYVCPLGQVLSAMVPAAVKKGAGGKVEKNVYLDAGADEIENILEAIRGRKQRAVIQVVANEKAFDADSAIECDWVLEKAETGPGTIKSLLHKGVLKIRRKTVYKSLPIVAENLLVKNKNVVLNTDQANALDEVNKRIQSDEFSVALLHGVTDSGKTEVYIRAIEKALAMGKAAIVLLPEIALTAQTVRRFSVRFKDVAVVHSKLTAVQRNVEWQRIKAGQAKVVIGARSAVFAPVDNLGVIIVDEEHEPSYKQDTAPRYHGRDVAIKRAQLTGSVCLLGSATPCLESLYNCQKRKHFVRLTLPKRVMNLPEPEMCLVDMTKEKFEKTGTNLISGRLEEAIGKTLENGNQAILLLNRRGYSNFVFCPSCRYSIKCRNCDVALTFHKSERMRKGAHIAGRMHSGYAMCHYCMSQTLVPTKCPMCGKGVTMIGLGSQKLSDEVKKRFSNARVVRVDSDSMQKQNYYQLLSDFDKGKIDILTGTQILAKGLHFPNVTLVGIISADSSLELPDFRANERTYSLICQVAGRAGRSPKGGSVFVQTFMPGSEVIAHAVKGDFAGFVASELKHRANCQLPPFGRVAIVRLKDMSEEKLNAAAENLAEKLRDIAHNLGLELKILGPCPALIARIQRHYRMQIVVQSKHPAEIGRLFRAFRDNGAIKPTVKVQIDIDPVNLF